MQRRRIAGLDTFLNTMNMMLWPRFQAIIDMHIGSLKNATLLKVFPVKDLHPHYIVRRYAEFAASILALNQGYDDTNVVYSLGRMRAELEVLCGKMASEFPIKKQGLTFWINNIDLCLSIFNETSQLSWAALEPERKYFEILLSQRIQDFVVEELQPHMGSMLYFLNQSPQAQRDAQSLDLIAQEFNGKWKSSLSDIADSITSTFPNFQNGARVLHITLTQYVVNYRKFLALMDEMSGKMRIAPVGIQNVLVEIKKFKSSFQ